MIRVARDVYWRPLDDPGLEHVHVTGAGHGGVQAVGLILRLKDNAHLRCRYELETDAAWSTRRLAFSVSDAQGDARRLVLEGDGAGAWTVDGTPRPDLDGCLDVDIQITPLTNTLPIRRLGLGAGQSRDLRVCYIAVPLLDVQPVEQRYHCNQPFGPGVGLYRYEGLFRDFAADLPVDEDGLVIDYPETFARVWPL